MRQDAEAFQIPHSKPPGLMLNWNRESARKFSSDPIQHQTWRFRVRNLECFSVLAHRLLIAAAVAALVGLTAGPSVADDMTPQEAQKIGVDAYIYGYSLITSDVTRAAFTNVKAPNPRTFQAPLNQFVSLPKYPP